MKLRHWIVALLLLFTGALHAQTASIADLARHSQYNSVKISPDGEYLAATAVVKGQTVLALIHIADSKGKLIRGQETSDVIDFWWASSNRVVYSVGIPRGGYDRPLPTGELFGVNADGSDPKLLYGQRKALMNSASNKHHGVELGAATFIASNPYDPFHVLISISRFEKAYGSAVGALRSTADAVPAAYSMDVRDGALAEIIAAPAPNMQFVADHQGRIRFAYGGGINGNGKVYIHPTDSFGWRPLSKTGDEQPFAMELTHSTGFTYPMAFSRDDSVAYFHCARANTGYGICRWNPASDTWQTVWTNPKVETDGLLMGTTYDDVIGVSFTDGRPGMSLFDSQSADAKALVTLLNQFPGESVRFVSGTSDGRLSIVLVEADADPGTFYLYDRDAKKLTVLLSRASWINPERMAGKQPFEFAARDGLKLQGYVSFPSGQENAKHLPMVVFVHGGPYGIRDKWDYDPLVQVMTTYGYAVLQVNFRGSSGYGDNFGRAGWGEWGGKMQDDVTDATHWAIAQGIADPQRICIFGASYGGYSALEGAVKEPDLYKCAIGYVGIYDLSLMYTRGDIPQSASGENYLQRVLGNDMGVLARRSPIDQLDRLKAKVMLVVGDKDTRVPPVQGNNLHNELLKRHIAHEWMEKPDEMHGFYDEANLAELYANVVRFLGANIGPYVTTTNAAVTNKTASVH